MGSNDQQCFSGLQSFDLPGLVFSLPVDHRCCTQAIIVVVLSINDKHTLSVKHLPTISPFGIDGN
jgi:hypothetical protein